MAESRPPRSRVPLLGRVTGRFALHLHLHLHLALLPFAPFSCRRSFQPDLQDSLAQISLRIFPSQRQYPWNLFVPRSFPALSPAPPNQPTSRSFAQYRHREPKLRIQLDIAPSQYLRLGRLLAIETESIESTPLSVDVCPTRSNLAAPLSSRPPKNSNLSLPTHRAPEPHTFFVQSDSLQLARSGGAIGTHSPHLIPSHIPP